MDKYEIDAVMEELGRVSERVDTTVPSEYPMRCREVVPTPYIMGGPDIVPTPYPNRMMTNPDRWSNAVIQSTSASELQVDFNNDPFIREMLQVSTRTVSTAQQIATQDMATVEERILSAMQSSVGILNTEQTRHTLYESLRRELDADSREHLGQPIVISPSSYSVEIRNGDLHFMRTNDRTNER